MVANPGFTRTAIGLHWTVALSILAAWMLGLYMVELPLSPQKLKLVAWHKWLGVTIFLLMTFRVLWRLTHPAPPVPGSMPQWQRDAGAASHLLLYILMLTIPLSGWLFSSASGVPVVYLGLVQLPDWVGRNRPLADLLRQIHVILNCALFVIVCAHVAAALRHHFVQRDDVLRRMVPCITPHEE
jgi:cytochrome b561